jgi:Family of unknown function (DUF5318)
MPEAGRGVNAGPRAAMTRPSQYRRSRGARCLHSAPMRHHVDYVLARRAVLRDLRTGRRDREDVCDAHPELLRAGRHVGEAVGRPCPVCGHGSLRLVSYVYGDRLARANGRCITSDAELDRLDAAHDEFTRYVVEVCLDCHWNFLQRHELHGRRHAPAPPRSGRRARSEAG